MSEDVVNELVNNVVTDERPLVTFALIAYNQEKYIREAIKGAFLQTYEPLEIILSDDCSSDGTFAIMQQAATMYCGPHKIVLNRNDKNLHIGGHVNTVNRLATGELVIAAAGDDVSVPHRVRTLVEAWLESDKNAGVLHSACRTITAEGKQFMEPDGYCPCLAALETAEQAARTNAFVIGATEAWNKDIFRRFGDLRLDLIHEDIALPFRSLLLGKTVVYVDQPLVTYRVGVGISANASQNMVPLQRRTELSRLLVDMQQKLDDMKIIPNPPIERIVHEAAHRCEIALQFEDGFPRISEWLPMVRCVGFSHVLRMALKRLRNLCLDN